MSTGLANRVKTFFASGYDAIKSNGKRGVASAVLKQEDDQLKNRDRDKMSGAGRELHRNFSIVAWAIRKHLDYVTQFDFQMRTGNDDFDVLAETLMHEWSRPANCDVAGRHSLSKMIRMAEGRSLIDNDIGVMFRSQGRLQAIESELIRTPSTAEPSERWFNGVAVNQDGRAIGYGLHKRVRDSSGFEFVKRVKASNMVLHGCFERFDQVRGVSPLASAYNSFKDVYEGIDYALAKMKVEQLFALVIHSANTSGHGDHTRQGDGTYEVDMGKGPVKLEMDHDDDAKFLKTDNPGSNTREFLHVVLGMAIKALDLPFNFYDESHTNFFGSRAAWLLYDRSCHAKRANVLELLRRITVWRLRSWIIEGRLTLPGGMSLRQLPFEWVPRGMPWWDPAKEIKGDLLAISAGLDNPQRICKERGRGEFEDNIKQIAKAQAVAAEHGVEVSFAVNQIEGSNNDEGGGNNSDD